MTSPDQEEEGTALETYAASHPESGMRTVKRDAARVKTILNEKATNDARTSGATGAADNA